MTDRSLSRRQSLLGLGVAGTTLGGIAVGITSVYAGDEETSDEKPTDEQTDGDEETADDGHGVRKDDLEFEFVCNAATKSKFRVHNDGAADVTLTWAVDTDEIDVDDHDDDDLRGTVTVPAGDAATFWVGVGSRGARVTLYDKKEKKVATETIRKGQCEKAGVAERIELEALCYRAPTDDDDDDDELTVEPSDAGATATYTTTLTVGPDNDGDSLNDIVADFTGTGVDISNVGTGDVGVELNGMDVTDDLEEASGSNDGQTLTLGFGGNNSLEEGDELTVELSDVQNPADDGEYEADYTINSQSAAETTTLGFTIGDDEDDGDDGNGETSGGKAKFRVHNHNKKTAVKVHWSVKKDKHGGKIHVDSESSETFWAPLLEDRKTSVTLRYDGEVIATAKADTDTECSDCDT